MTEGYIFALMIMIGTSVQQGEGPLAGYEYAYQAPAPHNSSLECQELAKTINENVIDLAKKGISMNITTHSKPEIKGRIMGAWCTLVPKKLEQE